MTQELLDIVYDIPDEVVQEERHILAVLVDNEFGVLNRVVGLFSSRGYNIESLTVAEVDTKKHLSRITVVTRGSMRKIKHIIALLERMVPVHKVHDLTVESPFVERELALVKVVGKNDDRVEALRIADIFRAKPVDTTIDSFIFEITGTTEKVNTFIDLMRPLGLEEVCRTGVASVARGKKGI
ncbi:MAG: acetolactate synthase small subunit [Alphaproteobacteria bacterium]|nr:acetolactate synthase small subunit [Alphaproteobacteria bacterium]